MDREWSDGAVSSPTMSGVERKAGEGGRDGVDCPGSPLSSSPAAQRSPAASSSPSGRPRRSAQKRVVTVALADVSGPRPKGVGEGNTPTDSWAWRKYGQKPIKGSPFPRAQQNRQAAQKPREQPCPAPEPADSGETHHGDGAAGVVTVCPAAIEVHDEFRWLYDGVSVNSSTSPSDIDAADEMQLYDPMLFFGGAVIDTAALLLDELGDAVAGGELDGERLGEAEEDAMFEGLGELPECATVFRRRAGDGLAMAGGVKVEQPAESTS
ncbi:hypothetical protein ABZP36_014747 [Zizania latifolia]